MHESDVRLSRRSVMKGLIGIALLISETGCVSSNTNVPARSVSPAATKTMLGNLLYTYQSPGWVFALAWSPDSKRIASASYDVSVWNAMDGSNGLMYKGHAGADVNSISWSPDGRYIASGGRDKTAQVWNADNGQQAFTYSGHTKAVYAVRWSPNGVDIVSGGADSTVQVWQAIQTDCQDRHKALPRPYTIGSSIVVSLCWYDRGSALCLPWWLSRDTHSSSIPEWHRRLW